jgi:hypothetical protein
MYGAGVKLAIQELRTTYGGQQMRDVMCDNAKALNFVSIQS